jgi:hypothetical protein
MQQPNSHWWIHDGGAGHTRWFSQPLDQFSLHCGEPTPCVFVYAARARLHALEVPNVLLPTLARLLWHGDVSLCVASFRQTNGSRG